MKQGVRIIGGKFRGKQLGFPDLPDLRPTPNAVRETLFNWLMHDIHGARCLDCFAGSGALGLEAYSRGAATVTFLEKDPLAFKSLQKNLASFQTQSLQALQQDALAYLQSAHYTFDIVFLDPPFSQQLLPACLEQLAITSLLPAGGLVYVEAPKALTPETGWEILKEKKSGQVVFCLLKKG